MSAWKEHNAIVRIYNAFKRNKEKVYPQEIEALKLLNELIEDGAERMATDNILFTKMLCCMLTYHIQYYGSIDMAKKKVFDDLGVDINNHIIALTKTLNDADKIKLLSDIKPEQIKASQKLILEKLNSNWSLDNVKKSLYKSANDYITDIRNYG